MLTGRPYLENPDVLIRGSVSAHGFLFVHLKVAPAPTVANSHFFSGTGASPTKFLEFTVSEAPRVPGELAIRVSEVEVSWQSEVNTSYLVEFKTELPGAAWLPLTNCVPGEGKVLKLYDKVAANGPKRFYRVTTNCVSGLRSELVTDKADGRSLFGQQEIYRRWHG